MPKAYETWTVLPHRPIEKLESNLWRVEGDLPGGNGTRVMTLAKLASGGVIIHNAIALEEAQMKELEAFGTPEAIIVPNGFHRLDAKVFKQRYPNANVFCPAQAVKKVKQVCEVAGTLDDAPKDATVRLYHLDGTKQHEGVVEVTSGAKKSIVLNDAINNLPKLGGVIGVMLSPTGRVSIPRIFRWMFVKDKPKFRAGMEQLAAMPGLERLIVSHGRMMDKQPAQDIRDALATL